MGAARGLEISEVVGLWDREIVHDDPVRGPIILRKVVKSDNARYLQIVGIGSCQGA